MLNKAQLERLQALVDQKSGDPHLDAMKAVVVKNVVRDKLEEVTHA